MTAPKKACSFKTYALPDGTSTDSERMASLWADTYVGGQRRCHADIDPCEHLSHPGKKRLKKSISSWAR